MSSYSGWPLKERDNKNLVKTELTYLLPISSKVTPYVNITLDIGGALNAFKVLWSRKEEFKNLVIHLGDFHFMKKNFQASFFLLIN